MPAKNSFTTGGILLIDKRPGITSHDAVAITRRAAGTRKVGHAGTLDPMATGLLVLGLNSATRLLTFVVGLDKEYTATIRLGASTTTDDREGELLTRADPHLVAAVSPERITAGIADLTGAIEQVPSTVSAIKVDGRRAYALARAGETVELASRAVTVSAFDVLTERRVQDDDGVFLDLDVRVVCSSGTYIRALARDLGEFLGVGGHLTALRRTRIGPFEVTDATALDDLDVVGSLRSPADTASVLFPVLHLDAAEAVDLSNGKRIAVEEKRIGSGGAPRGDATGVAPRGDAAGAPGEQAAPASDPIAAIAPDGRLIGLVEHRGGRLKTLVNFPPDPVPSGIDPATGSDPVAAAATPGPATDEARP